MATFEPGSPRGYDAAKKVAGRKRHIAGDMQGLLLSVVVHTAFIQDANGADGMLERTRQLQCWLPGVFAGGTHNRVPTLLVYVLLGPPLLIISQL